MLCWCSGRLTSTTGPSPLPGKSWWQYTTGKVQGFVIELGPSRSKSFVFSIAKLARQLLTPCHSDLFLRGLASSRGEDHENHEIGPSGGVKFDRCGGRDSARGHHHDIHNQFHYHRRSTCPGLWVIHLRFYESAIHEFSGVVGWHRIRSHDIGKQSVGACTRDEVHWGGLYTLLRFHDPLAVFIRLFPTTISRI